VTSTFINTENCLLLAVLTVLKFDVEVYYF